MNFVMVGEDYRRFVKRFLTPTLIEVMYLGPDEFYEGNSPKAINEWVLKVYWKFPIYGDEFSHTDKPITKTINID